MSLESYIKEQAIELGFDAVGITTAEPVDVLHADYFRQWLDDGRAAEMGYLHRNTEKRFGPAKLLGGAKSVICVALNYRLGKDEEVENAPVRIARFGQFEDYHPFMKERLFALAEFIQAQLPRRAIKFKGCVDSVPIAERAMAVRAGLGFIGRNHMLICPELGSQILLGELITTLELEPDAPMENVSCGDCGKCIRACPTGALDFDGTFDARKCVSYLTIEAPLVRPASSRQGDGINHCKQTPSPLRGTPPSKGGEFSYIFGCDECILACPHETGKPERKNDDFQHHPEWQKLTPEQILSMTELEFQKIFAGSGFIRLGLEGLKRNCQHLH